MSNPKNILLISIAAQNELRQEPDFARMLRNDGNYVEVRQVLQGGTLAQIYRAFVVARGMQKFDLVITEEYMCTFGLCVRGALCWNRPMLAAIGFNVSRRYLTTPSRLANRLINGFFKLLSLVVVHSHAEQRIFIQKHDLDPSKVFIALFGFDIVPDPDVEIFKQGRPFDGAPYIYMVGRNNRDFATLQKALEGTNIPAIFVTSKDSEPDLIESDNVKLMSDLTFEECLGVMQNACVAVILLKDDHRGAGHMTAVSGMMLGKPHVFSDAEVLKDYLLAGKHGISVPLKAWEETRAAISRLYNDPDLARRQGFSAQAYARDRLSNHAFQHRIYDLLCRLLHN